MSAGDLTGKPDIKRRLNLRLLRCHPTASHPLELLTAIRQQDEERGGDTGKEHRSVMKWWSMGHDGNGRGRLKMIMAKGLRGIKSAFHHLKDHPALLMLLIMTAWHSQEEETHSKCVWIRLILIAV